MVEFTISGTKYGRIVYAKESGYLFNPHIGLILASVKGNLKYILVSQNYQHNPNRHFSCQFNLCDFPTLTS